MDKLILNGEISSSSTLVFNQQNRAFRYGDGLFETMHIEGGKVRFFNKHVNRLTSGMNALSMEIPGHFEKMENILTDFLLENNLQSGSLRWQVWREEGGKYSPDRFTVKDIIEYSPAKIDLKKINLGISNTSTVHFSQVSRFKTCNSLPYVIAGIEMKTTEFNDLILLDTADCVAECISSNIFWSNNKHWYTPSLKTGCVEGIMRDHVISVFKKSKTPLIEGEFGIEYFLDIQKAFITNSAGIYAVSVLGELSLSDYLNLPEELEKLRVL